MELRGFAAFSDESRHSEGQYRSVASVSVPAKLVVSLQHRVREFLETSGIGELKWHKIKSAKSRFCANVVLKWFVEEVIPIGGRVDVVIWDIADSRHRIVRRDDRKNFERMFFHLHKGLMSRRPVGEDWHLRPDERLDIDWKTIHSCLQTVGGWRKYFENPLLGESLSIASFNVSSFKHVSSKDTPLCQVADLFAGMAAYSRLKCEELKQWLEDEKGQTRFFDNRSPMSLSGRDKERFPVIRDFYDLCRSSKLGVSLETTGYLRTRDPARPINFWHYVPQHDADRTPTIDV